MPKPATKESIFDIVIEMLFIALVFLAPVIFDRRVGIVFSLTKVTTIRIVMIAILSVWAIKLLLRQDHKFIRTPLDYPVLSYLVAATIACLTSVLPLMSMMGFYGRYEGLSTLYVYGLLVYITTNFIKTKEQMLRIIYTVMIAGICMSFYGIIQRMGLDPYAWGGVITWQRVIGTIGQPNFLAAYADMSFILGLVVILRMQDLVIPKSFNWKFAYDIAQRVGLILSLLAVYVCVLYTISRGGFLGLFGGLALFFVCVKRDLVLSKWKELLALFILIAGMTLVTSLNPAFSPFGRVTSEISKNDEIKAQEATVITYSASLSRLETWKSAYKIIADRPLFGIGEEVLKMVFPRYETDKFRFYEGFHVKQDRCHNEVCDMAVTRGVITLFIYVWVLATFFFMGIKIIKGDYGSDQKLFAAGFMGASAAYLIQNQFSFGVVAITTLFWVMMGMTASIFVRAENTVNTAKDIDTSEIPWFSLVALLIISSLLVYLSCIQFRADIHFKNGKNSADYRQFDNAITEFQKSIAISPFEGGTWTHNSIATLNLGQIAGNMEAVKQAIQKFEVGTKIDPYNADNFYIMGRAYYVLSMVDPTVLNKILEVEKKAISIDPKYAEAYFMLGVVKERQGNLREAMQDYIKAIEIFPELNDAIVGLSNLSVKLGETNKLIETFKGFLIKFPNNPVFQENLAGAYVKMNDLKSAMKVYEEMLTVNPKNIKALINFGFLNARRGDFQKAKDLFESAVMIDPKSPDAHNGLGAVYLSTGQKAKAKDEFYQTLMVDPNNQYARQMMEVLNK